MYRLYSVNQSIDTPIGQWINQRINKSINRSIHQSTNKSINQSIIYSKSIDRLINNFWYPTVVDPCQEGTDNCYALNYDKCTFTESNVNMFTCEDCLTGYASPATAGQACTGMYQSRGAFVERNGIEYNFVSPGPSLGGGERAMAKWKKCLYWGKAIMKGLTLPRLAPSTIPTNKLKPPCWQSITEKNKTRIVICSYSLIDYLYNTIIIFHSNWSVYE